MKILCYSLLISILTTYNIKAQYNLLTVDKVKIINELSFNPNLHYHQGYNLSHRIKNYRLGNIKKETIDYGNDKKRVVEFLPDGQYQYIKDYKNDTLVSEYVYVYEGNKLIKELGKNEINYQHVGENIIGLNPNKDNSKFYRAKDTISIKTSTNRFEIAKKIEGEVFNFEKYAFEYMPNGDLKKIDIYLNNINTGVILNKFDSLERISEHHHIHSFSAFVQESKWQRNFRNSVYLFEYNNLNLIESYILEFYHGDKRQWIGTEVKLRYEMNQLEKNNQITITQHKEGKLRMNKIQFDETGNWVKQIIKTERGIKTITKTIEYY